MLSNLIHLYISLQNPVSARTLLSQFNQHPQPSISDHLWRVIRCLTLRHPQVISDHPSLSSAENPVKSVYPEAPLVLIFPHSNFPSIWPYLFFNCKFPVVDLYLELSPISPPDPVLSHHGGPCTYLDGPEGSRPLYSLTSVIACFFSNKYTKMHQAWLKLSRSYVA